VDARPLEKDVRRHIERVDIIEAAAADPGAGQDEGPVQEAQAPGAVEAERGQPEEFAQVPIAAGKFVGVPALPGLDDPDGPAEARSDEQIVKNELVRLVHFARLRPTL
jgi:hypothetical protein